MGRSKWKFVIVLCLGLLFFAGASITQARVFRNTAVWSVGAADSTCLVATDSDTTQAFPLFFDEAFVNKQGIAVTANVVNDSTHLTHVFQVSEGQTYWQTIASVYPLTDIATSAGKFQNMRNATLTNVPPAKWCRIITTQTAAAAESVWVWLSITGHFLKSEQ